MIVVQANDNEGLNYGYRAQMDVRVGSEKYPGIEICMTLSRCGCSRSM